MSNYEKIKQMNKEEMAYMLFKIFQHEFEKGFLTISDALEFLESEENE